MATLIQYLKIIVLIYVLIQYVFTSVYAKSLKNVFLYMALFVMLIYDFRLVSFRTYPDPIINIIFIVIAFYMHAHYKKGTVQLTLSDYHEAYLAEIIENVEEGIAIVNKDNLKILASNAAFEFFQDQYKEFISLHDMLSRSNRGERFIEINGFENETRYYKVSLTNIDQERIRIHIHDVSEDKINERNLKAQVIAYLDLIDGSSNISLLFNADFDLFQINKRASDFFNIAQDDVNKSGILQKEHGAFYECLDSMRKSIVGNENVQQVELFNINSQLKSLAVKMRSVNLNQEVNYFVEIEDQTYLYRIKNRLNVMHELAIEIEGTPLLEDVYFDLIANKPYFIGVDFNFEDKSKDAYLNFIHDLTERDHLLLDELKIAMSDERFLGKQLGRTLPLYVYKIARDYYNNPVGVVLRRTNTNKGLLNLEELGRYIIPHIREGIIVIDRKFNVIFVSEYMLRRLSYSRDKVLGNNLKHYIQDTKELNFFTQNDLLDTSHSIHFESELIVANHTLMPIDIVALSSKGGINDYIVLIIRDLQDKAFYQKRYLESQNKYDQILNSLQDGIIEMSLPDRKVSYIQSITSDSSFVGKVKTYYEWLEDIHVSDRAKVSESIDILTSEKISDIEFDYRVHRSGKWVWIRCNGKYIESNESDFILLIKRNIDDLKHTESELKESRYILSEAEKITNMAYWKFDIDTNEFYASNNFTNVLKLNALPRNIHYDGFVELIHPADRNYFKGKFSNMIWEGELLDIIFRIIRHGTIRYVQIIGRRYMNGNTPEYAIGNIVDVTDKLLVEQRLQTSQRMLNTIIEQSPTGIIVVKRLGHIEVINREAIEVLLLPDHFQMTSDFLKTHLINRYLTIGGNDFRIVVNKLFSDENSVHIVRGREGEIHKFMSSPLKDEEGRYTGNIIIIIPVSKGGISQ